MTRLRWWLALPALLLATSGPASAAEVRDKASLFSAEAVRKAQSELDRIEREYSVPVTIETIGSLNGEAIRDVTTRHASDVGARGIYILISKADSKIFAEASKGYQKYLTRDRLKTIDDTFIEQFKKRDFDAGLLKGVAKVDTTFGEAQSEAGGSLKPAPVAGARRATQTAPPVGRPRVAAQNSWGFGSLFTIVIVILGALLVFRLIGGLMSSGRGHYQGGGPGMGGPGYGQGGPGYGGGGGGGGGGGFMSSMFGGIGGALAGNWLYDQFSGRSHGSVNQSTYDPNTGVAPAPDASPEWGEGGAGGDWGGGTADAGGGAGGDWGGGGGDAGGGDWGGGGGGGGGDWGGGGGGGDDNGGGW